MPGLSFPQTDSRHALFGRKRPVFEAARFRRQSLGFVRGPADRERDKGSGTRPFLLESIRLFYGSPIATCR